MNRLLRTKKGCWTCRLRRKKCDGQHPECSTCTSLSIPCYGFGPKPDWMDHGEKEKAVAASLKQIVKHTSRRKPSSRTLKELPHLTNIAPKQTGPSSSHPDHTKSQNGALSSATTSSTEKLVNINPDHRTDTDAEVVAKGHEDLVLYPITANESVCLMHYLDNVFPLQFPMYKPGIHDGGRGWLIALLLKMKPLYHATIALSAYHRSKVELKEAHNHLCQVAHIIEQGKHLETCLVEFQRILRSLNESIQASSCPKEGTSLLALVVQLIYFEYFTGQGTEWRIHLQAATNYYRQTCYNTPRSFDSSETSKILMHGNLHFSQGDDPAVVQEGVTVRFLTAIVIWLDTIDAVTAGIAPRIPHDRIHDLLWNFPEAEFENIIGCKIWVLFQIGRIATLHEQKTLALAQGQPTNLALQETASNIRREILGGLDRMAMDGLCSADGTACDNLPASNTHHTAADDHMIVTAVYTYMASIYLHLVTHGFQKMDTINPTIRAAMDMLYTKVPVHILPSLICPLFVLGCAVSQEEDVSFFRKIFSSPPILDSLFDHRMKILPVLEETWRRRQTENGDLSWGHIIELTPPILPI